ncbi:hypothetical protein [Paraburkholderia sp.]|uniref:hypothetical protein n=1 Tax=Paraburkholderia sp. TaxID=1926495 RepID=UPI003D6FECF5
MFPASLIASAVLLAGCGGGGNNGKGSATGTPEQSDPAAQSEAFSCPADYKKLQITGSSIPNANLSMVSDDGVATLTIKTPASVTTSDLTVCLGKPNPVPAGVKADYVYEVKAQGNLRSMVSSTLTLNFTTNVVPTQSPPVIELAEVSGGTVTYKPLIQGAAYSARPNYSLAANAQDPGLYVVRLTK